MRRVVLACVFVFATNPGWGGAPIKAFEPGKPPPAEVLKDVPVKAVVAEFLDPDNTHLGKEVGYVLWRELLTSVSDQHGVGVIYAHAAGKKRLVDMLQDKYHEAALEIAKSQNARMAIWGALTESDGVLAVDTYLSLVGDVPQQELAVKMIVDDFGRKKPSGYEARVSRTRFNFPRVFITKEQLFDRPLMVAADTVLYNTAGRGKVLRQAQYNETLHTDGVEGEWFRVLLADGTHGYINSINVYLPPREVDASDLPLGAKPAENQEGETTWLPSNTIGAVLEARFAGKSGLFFRIKTSQGEGWVPADRARPHFSMPLVAFTAGLYRYQLGRYDLAASAFGNYTHLQGVERDAPSLSTAYQLLAASYLMRNTPADWALHSLDAAIETTPFDAGAYSMRALASLSKPEGRVGDCLGDLRHALDLDSEQADARNTVALLLGIKPGRPNPIEQRGMSFTMTARDVETLHMMAEKYRISAK